MTGRHDRKMKVCVADLDSRCGDDDLGIDQLLVECGSLALLVRGSHEGVALVLEPFAQAKLVLGGAKQTWLFLCVLVTLVFDQLTWTTIAGRTT
jgi:hypothetical protein